MASASAVSDSEETETEDDPSDAPSKDPSKAESSFESYEGGGLTQEINF